MKGKHGDIVDVFVVIISSHLCFLSHNWQFLPIKDGHPCSRTIEHVWDTARFVQGRCSECVKPEKNEAAGCPRKRIVRSSVKVIVSVVVFRYLVL